MWSFGFVSNDLGARPTPPGAIFYTSPKSLFFIILKKIKFRGSETYFLYMIIFLTKTFLNLDFFFLLKIKKIRLGRGPKARALCASMDNAPLAICFFLNR